MIRFDNPFDISKDGQNPFIDGIRIHIRASADNKERIIEYIKKYVPITGDSSPLMPCVSLMLFSAFGIALTIKKRFS